MGEIIETVGSPHQEVLPDQRKRFGTNDPTVLSDVEGFEVHDQIRRPDGCSDGGDGE